MKTKCVIFDFENTLAKLSVDWKDAFLKIADIYTKHGVPREIVDQFKYAPIYLLHGVYEEMLQLFPKEKTERIQKEALKTMERYELEGVKASELMPNSRETLMKLKDFGIKVGIVTSTSSLSVTKTLEKFGLTNCVDAIFSRDSPGRPKPSPDHVLACLEALKCGPENALMVGDDLKDIAAAKNARVCSIGYLPERNEAWRKMSTDKQEIVARDRMAKNADKTIEDLSEIIRIIRARNSIKSY